MHPSMIPDLVWLALPLFRYPPFPSEPFQLQEGVETFHGLADSWPFIYNQSKQPQQQPPQHHNQPTQHQQQPTHSLSWPSLLVPDQQATTTTTTTVGVTNTTYQYTSSGVEATFNHHSSFHPFPSTVSTREEQPEEEDDLDVELSLTLIEQGSDSLDGSTGYLSDQSVSYDDAIGIWHDHTTGEDEHLTKRIKSDTDSDSGLSAGSSTLSLAMAEEAAFDEMIDQLLEMDELEDTNRPLLMF